MRAVRVHGLRDIRIDEVPEPVVLPLERFAEGLELHRRRDALKVVFTP